ncbi:MAG: flagellar hook-length control protein FliK [Nevskiales bacterium]|nr:flagellar hook-length control protein FliK [Nevskiales bacterium]
MMAAGGSVLGSALRATAPQKAGAGAEGTAGSGGGDFAQLLGKTPAEQGAAPAGPDATSAGLPAAVAAHPEPGVAAATDGGGTDPGEPADGPVDAEAADEATNDWLLGLLSGLAPAADSRPQSAAAAPVAATTAPQGQTEGQAPAAIAALSAASVRGTGTTAGANSTAAAGAAGTLTAVAAAAADDAGGRDLSGDVSADLGADFGAAADAVEAALAEAFDADGVERPVARDASMAPAETGRLQAGLHAAASLHAHAATTPGNGSAPAAATPPVPQQAPLQADHPDFVADLGERIAWQLDADVSEASIELHPAELGAVTVRIETRGDQAQVQFVAADAATRQLLSQALPQLRDMLGGSGVNLARSQVESGARRGRDGAHGDAGGELAAVGAAPRRRVSGIVLVDAYV